MHEAIKRHLYHFLCSFRHAKIHQAVLFRRNTSQSLVSFFLSFIFRSILFIHHHHHYLVVICRENGDEPCQCLLSLKLLQEFLWWGAHFPSSVSRHTYLWSRRNVVHILQDFSLVPVDDVINREKYMTMLLRLCPNSTKERVSFYCLFFIEVQWYSQHEGKSQNIYHVPSLNSAVIPLNRLFVEPRLVCLVCLLKVINQHKLRRRPADFLFFSFSKFHVCTFHFL